MLEQLAYLNSAPKQTALLKAQCSDFIVREQLGYEMSGDGEFIAVKVRKTNNNTLFVGEQLAKFAGISSRNMGYAGLKDRNAVTEQWFCLQMPGKATPDFSQFQLEGVEILAVTRHNRKIRVGSLLGNEFEILLRGVQENDELKVRLDFVKNHGFPNYFMEQRFGRDNHNLTQALRWAAGEIKVKDRNKRGFYLSAARSAVFNAIVSTRLQQQLAHTVLVGDILQLNGSHSWFVVSPKEDLALLQQRVQAQDLLLTAPLIGMEPCTDFEQQIVQQFGDFTKLMQQEKMKSARRPLLMRAQGLHWSFVPEGLWLKFYLPAGSYATALIRELVNVGDE